MDNPAITDSLWMIPHPLITYFEPAYEITDDIIELDHKQIDRGNNWELRKADALASLKVPFSSLLEHLDLSQKKKCTAVIVNLKLIFNIQLENVYQELKLDYLNRIPKKLTEQIFFAHTKRRYFHQSFVKHHLVPTAKQKDSENYYYFIIEQDPIKPQYFQIKILNEYLYCCDIHSYISLETIDRNIKLTFFRNYVKQKTVYCLFNGKADIVIHTGIIQFFINHYKNIMFIHWANPETVVESQPSIFGRITLQNGKQLYADVTPQRYVLATAPFSEENLVLLKQISRSYNWINEKIFEEPINPCLQENIFFFNSACTEIYGPFYNYLRNIMPNFESNDFESNEHLKFAYKINSLCSTKQMNREMGHYAIKVKNKDAIQGEEGVKKPRQKSLVCRVCSKNNDSSKSSKSRYQCEKCSIVYSRPIGICLQHFFEFHKNQQYYIPKGAKKGAVNYELKKMNENKTSNTHEHPIKSPDIAKEAEQVLRNIQSTVNQNMPIIEGFKNYVHQVHSKDQPFHVPFPQSIILPSPFIPTDNQFRDILIKSQHKDSERSVKQEKMAPCLKEQEEMPNPYQQGGRLELIQQEINNMSEEDIQNIDEQHIQEMNQGVDHNMQHPIFEEQEIDASNNQNSL